MATELPGLCFAHSRPEASIGPKSLGFLAELGIGVCALQRVTGEVILGLRCDIGVGLGGSQG